ncbi:hypothetical protein ACQU0X_26725 [Pseudovibrio ascidiaceicola]|uniref:hypothetical protein n=1 Tax=Pseudovibrio ascidiaceicola TaxID=285279 RepID=UPI003D36F55E
MATFSLEDPQCSTRIAIGFVETNRKVDAIDAARSHIERFFGPPELCYLGVVKYGNRYLYEIHEGGSGHGYIEKICEILSEQPDAAVWFPSSNRVQIVELRFGTPRAKLLSEKTSKEFLDADSEPPPPLPATTKLKPAVNRGESILVGGVATYIASLVFLAGAAISYAYVGSPINLLTVPQFKELPHAQWDKVKDTQVDEIVSRLEFADGKWKIDKRAHSLGGNIVENKPKPGVGGGKTQ